MCVRERGVLRFVPKPDKQCSAVRDPGSWAKELHRVPWIHIKYVGSRSRGAVGKFCNPRNSSWVAAHHAPGIGMSRRQPLPIAFTPTEGLKQVLGGLST